MQWLQKAAISNRSDAQLLLGAAYYEGARGLPKDRNQALHWLRAAAAQGNKEAQAAVAVIEGKFLQLNRARRPSVSAASTIERCAACKRETDENYENNSITIYCGAALWRLTQAWHSA